MDGAYVAEAPLHEGKTAMIGRLIQHLIWRWLGAHRVTTADLDALEHAIAEQAERMGLR